MNHLVRQAEGRVLIDVGLPEFPQQDHAWVTDVFVDYRLPQRLGILSIGAKNVFDKSITLFDTDPTLPIVPARRFVYARARLTF